MRCDGGLDYDVYLDVFNDGAPGEWRTEYRHTGWQVSLPNGTLANIPSPVRRAFWEEEPEVDATSSLLWVRSLRYVRNFRYSGSLAWNDIEATVRTFAQWERGLAPEFDSIKSGSLDHQIALRLRTACVLAAECRKGAMDAVTKRRISSTLECLVKTDCELAESLDIFSENNHGIMLGIAIVHAGVFFPSVVSSVSLSHWAELVASTLLKIVDDDGLAPENTVGYQLFFVQLMDDFIAFLEWAGLRIRLSEQLSTRRDVASVVTQRLLLPNGNVPPLGDSAGGRQSQFASHPGHVFSSSNGIWVQSTDDTYFSAKCGFRSVIHKQADDGSVILWKRGYFILGDAGLISYDRSNEPAIYGRGQRGHSATVFARFDQADALNLISFSNNTSRMNGALWDDCPDSALAGFRADVSYDGVRAVTRRGIWLEESRFELEDTYCGSTPESMVTRLILDPRAAELHKAGNTVSVKLGSMKVSYEFCSIGNQPDLVQISLVKTVVAAKAYKGVDAWSVEARWRGTVAGDGIRTSISVG